MAYESPIKMVYQNLQQQIESKLEGDVLKVVQSYDIQVDAEELKKALAYDRKQYDKGFNDGKLMAMADVYEAREAGRNEILRKLREFLEGNDDDED